MCLYTLGHKFVVLILWVEAWSQTKNIQVGGGTEDQQSEEDGGNQLKMTLIWKTKVKISWFEEMEAWFYLPDGYGMS